MRIAVLGGGILGLATARLLSTSRPDAEVVVLEKEAALARHQTGHNSGVVHAGLYYAPGSLKARLCTRGRELMKDFCARSGALSSMFMGGSFGRKYSPICASPTGVSRRHCEACAAGRSNLEPEIASSLRSSQ